jgi:hypothetical protein
MREDWSHIEKYRVRSGSMQSDTGDKFGQFMIPLHGVPVTLCVIATKSHDGDGIAGEWDHVSAHARLHLGKPNEKQRTPTWDEMCTLKSLFWSADECVVQYHPAASEYVNTHPHVLHLWRHPSVSFPMPPMICV